MGSFMQVKDELVIYGQALSQRGLVWGHSGNISARADDDTFLISAGGSDLGLLLDDDFVDCRIDSDAYEGLRQPSMEVGLHRGIYRSCADAKAVIHSQPFYSTMVACTNIEIKTDLLPEAMVYLGDVARVPYHHAGSDELAQAVAVKAFDSRILLLANHGVVCWGDSLGQAFLATETLELLCRMIVAAHNGTIEMNYLGGNMMQDFKEHLKRLGRLP
ncbi:class II aldolase/adducin family protein [Chloroflexota bacterium]